MPRVLVVCATPEEAAHVVAALDTKSTSHANFRSWKVFKGWLSKPKASKIRVAVLITNVGVCHAAVATTAFLSEEERRGQLPNIIVSCGCAGAHEVRMMRGDVVIGTKVVPLDQIRIRKDGSTTKPVIRLGMSLDGADAYYTDERLLSVCKANVDKVALPPWPGSEEAPKVWHGAIGSSDRFTQHAETLRKMIQLAGTVCEEMESVSLAAAAAEYGIPFLAIKDIANNELGADGDDWEELDKKELGRRAAIMTMAMLPVLCDKTSLRGRPSSSPRATRPKPSVPTVIPDRIAKGKTSKDVTAKKKTTRSSSLPASRSTSRDNYALTYASRSSAADESHKRASRRKSTSHHSRKHTTWTIIYPSSPPTLAVWPWYGQSFYGSMGTYNSVSWF